MHVSIRNSKGFSLVELMVVVAIIGILAAIAVPNFQRFTAKSKQSEAKAVLSALYGAEKSFQQEWQEYSGGFNNIGYRPSGWVRYNHGFAAAGPAVPVGYTGPTWDTTNFNTMAFCGGGAIGANGCGVINTPNAPTNPPAAAVTPTTTAFTAGATADIQGTAANQDQWTVNQNKQFTNPQSGLP